MVDIMDKVKQRTNVSLPSKMKDDINVAILDYLQKYKFEKAFAAFSEETGINLEEYFKNSN